MPKSKDAFRTISEVAEWLDTPAHVLRFWESKFTQVKPVKRAGGRRYYRPADMQLLGGIKKLLHDDGLTIKGAQKLLREHGVKHVAALSQPLEEDLIEEAAYEPDAQPEPVIETPATVLSFPNRSESIETSQATEVVPAPESATPPSKPDEGPAFGSDALPAFLRRAPTPQAPNQTSMSNEPDTPSDTSQTRDAAEKVAIDPIARLEPIDPPQTVAPEGQSAVEQAKTTVDPVPTAQPMFSRRAPAPDVPKPVDIPDAPKSTPVQTAKPPAPTAPRIEVPTAAKIAPELDSYTAPSGVLAALPGTRRISRPLASDMSAHLNQLRALRDRMRG